MTKTKFEISPETINNVYDKHPVCDVIYCLCTLFNCISSVTAIEQQAHINRCLSVIHECTDAKQGRHFANYDSSRSETGQLC